MLVIFYLLSGTPSLAPRAPPSRLKPKREQQKVVVFLRERKQGAGHYLHQPPSFRPSPGFTAFLTRSPAESDDPGSDRPPVVSNDHSRRAIAAIAATKAVHSPPAPGVLFLPGIVGRFADPHLPTRFAHFLARFRLPQHRYDLLFRMTLLWHRPFSSPGLFCLRYPYFPLVQFFGCGSQVPGQGDHRSANTESGTHRIERGV